MLLERITNICLTLACLATIVVLGQRFMAERSQPSPKPIGYKLGETLSEPKGTRFSAKNQTVLVFLSTKCRFCDASMPFYRRLSEKRAANHFQIVAVGLEDVDSLSKYLESHRLKVDHVTKSVPGEYRVSGSPTLIVVDSTGRTTGMWRGQLGEREAEVEALLGEGKRPIGSDSTFTRTGLWSAGSTLVFPADPRAERA